MNSPTENTQGASRKKSAPGAENQPKNSGTLSRKGNIKSQDSAKPAKIKLGSQKVDVVHDGDWICVIKFRGKYYLRCSLTLTPLGARLERGRNRGPMPRRLEYPKGWEGDKMYWEAMNLPMSVKLAVVLCDRWDDYLNMDPKKLGRASKRLKEIEERYEEAMNWKE